MSLASTEWLQQNIDKIKIIDCSWHMPNSKRNGNEEYQKEHIPNAIFFDLDKNSDQNTALPHMLTDESSWGKIVSSFGISNNDEILIYDNSDVISSCRCWYNFIYYGHDEKLVHVLDGGFKKWKLENKETTNILPVIEKSIYKVFEKQELVKNKKQIDKNIINKEFLVVDARSRSRFNGEEPEPRKGLRSGSIPNSLCLPFKECINEDHTFKKKKELLTKFKSILGDELIENVVFSCGSGVTASVLALAYSLINNKYVPTIYDGSWSEYGKL